MLHCEVEVDIKSMRYPSGVRNLIQDLRFTVPSGTVTSVVGPSGAGKTTLLRVIAGLERRFEGTIRINGVDVKRPCRNVQIVFQDNRLLPWKSVGDNLRFVTRGSSEENDCAVRDALSKVGLLQKRESWPKELSGGEESRVAFARVFLDPPGLLLLDEPFRDVDLITRHRLQTDLLEHLARSGMTVILVSHSVEDVALLSDTIYAVSGEAMRITGQFEVALPKPRTLPDRRVEEVMAQVTSHFLNRAVATVT